MHKLHRKLSAKNQTKRPNSVAETEKAIVSKVLMRGFEPASPASWATTLPLRHHHASFYKILNPLFFSIFRRRSAWPSSSATTTTWTCLTES